ncbi:MAG: restriction endonuclease subunit S, partial [Prochloraceae cyanobacterium]
KLMKQEDLGIKSELPIGWIETSLQTVGQWCSGGTPSRKESKYFGKGIYWIKSGDLLDDVIIKVQEQITQLGLDNSSAKLLPVDTISMAMYGATIGKLGILSFPAATNQACANVIPNKELVNVKYLFYYLLSERKNLINKGQGGAQPNISQQIIKAHPVKIAPLNEQQRIVAKLEKILAKINTCQQRLERIPTILKRFRQSVLAAACSGRLTADWREQNPNVEPAEELLKRIQEERKRRYEEECAKAKEEGRRKPKAYKNNIESINYSDLPELPQTWKWERLVNIAEIIGGVAKGRKFGDRKTVMLPYLRVANVQDGFLDLSEIKEIKALPEDLEKYRLKYGDILFNEGGDRDKLGRGTIWKNEIDNCIHQNHVYRGRLCDKSITSEYISFASKTDYAIAFFFNNASQTVNLASINITSLGSLPLAIPPISEQKEIVRRVEALFKKCESIEKRYQKAKAYTDKLTQSILAKAFRGELVPQDPNDESAEILLEKIRAEKAQQEKQTKAKKKTKRKTTTTKKRSQTKPRQLEIPDLN